MESWRVHLEHIPSNYGIAYSFNEFILSDEVFFDKENQLLLYKNTTLPDQSESGVYLKRALQKSSFAYNHFSIFKYPLKVLSRWRAGKEIYNDKIIC